MWVDLHLPLLICVAGQMRTPDLIAGCTCCCHWVFSQLYWSLFYEPYVHTQPRLWSMESCLFNDYVVEKRDTIMPCIVLFLRTLLNLLMLRFQLSLLMLRFQLNLSLNFFLEYHALYSSHQHFCSPVLVTLFVISRLFFLGCVGSFFVRKHPFL